MTLNNSRIVLLARLIRRIALAALVLGAVSWLWASWTLFGGGPDSLLGRVHFAIGTGDGLSPGLAWLAGSVALAVTAFGLLRLMQLMRIYESGVVFDPRASQLLSSFAAAIFLRELIDVLAPPMLSFVARLNDGPAQVSLHIGSTQAHVLFVTIIFVLIAKIMAAGHQLADDNAKII